MVSGWVGGPTVARQGRLYGLRIGDARQPEGSLYEADSRRGDPTAVLASSTFGAMAALPVSETTEREPWGGLLRLLATVLLAGLSLGIRRATTSRNGRCSVNVTPYLVPLRSSEAGQSGTRDQT